ncbi:Uncharacterised protein [Mycobacteroides abscessus subsp. abscessus]|nr:Uncharacterised protein [Mycobacteroides abscessus subsp. abscessus]
MTERKALGAKEFLGLRAGDAGLEFGLAGFLVEGDESVQAAQVQRHDGGEAVADRVESADHAGATAERDDRDAVFGAVLKHLGDLVLGARQQDRVRRVLLAGVLAAQQVQRRLAAGPQQAVVIVGAAELVTDDRCERDAVGVCQCGRAQRDLVGLELGHWGRVDAQGRGQ